MRILSQLSTVGVLLLSTLSARTDDLETGKLLPATLAGDWVLKAGPRTYTPVDLFKYIDGEAEHYAAYGFRQAAVGEYESKADSKAQLTVDLYDMGTSAQAFGIYSSLRSPRVEGVEVGAEGYLSGSTLDFWRSRYFVHLYADRQLAGFREAAFAVAHALSDVLVGESTPPPVCGLLPADKQVPKTLKWYRQDFLGHSFLKNAAIANYEHGEKPIQLFVVSCESRASAADSLKQYREAVSKRAQLVAVPGGLPETAVITTRPYYGTVAVAPVGKQLVGVMKARDAAEAAALLAPLLVSLAKRP